MEVFVPVSAVATPAAPTTIATEIAPIGAETISLAPLTGFLEDHFVQGGYQGGKMVLDALQMIRSTADSSKQEFLRSLPSIGVHLREFPSALTQLFSEDPAILRQVERKLGALSGDVAAAAATGTLFTLARMVDSTAPFAVAAGAILGCAVGGSRFAALIQMTRETLKED